MFFTILPFYGGNLIYQSLVRELKKNPQNLPEKDNDVPPCSCLSLKKVNKNWRVEKILQTGTIAARKIGFPQESK